MMKLSRALAVLAAGTLFAGCNLESEPASFEGRVVSFDGNPVPNVTILVGGNIPILANGKTIASQTDASGLYRYNFMPDGSYTITPSSDLYQFAPGSYNVAGVAGTPTISSLDFVRFQHKLWIQDVDGDGFGDDSLRLDQEADPGAPYIERPDNVQGQLDCDDNDSAINPGAQEIHGNAVDENCDGSSQAYVYRDLDKDNFGNPHIRLEIVQGDPAPFGYVFDNSDCDDSSVNVNPAATDIPGNGIDENCEFGDARRYYEDKDSDGFGNTVNNSNSPVVVDDATTDAPAGFVVGNNDCDDDDAAIFPGQNEDIGNGIDDNCDGSVDIAMFYPDMDQDGIGNIQTGVPIVELDTYYKKTHYVPANVDPDGNGPKEADAIPDHDCDDTKANVYPALVASDGTVFDGAFEAPDAVDNDCDGSTEALWFEDLDGDGFGNAAVTASYAYPQPAGWAAPSTDCNDDPANGGASVYPGAPELPEDGIDQNCDGSDNSWWYRDNDDDGFANYDESTRVNRLTNPTNRNLDPPVVYVPLDHDPDGFGPLLPDGLPDIDCDDNDPNTYPAIFDSLGGFYEGGFDAPNDTRDQNCDGIPSLVWFVDIDEDGYGRDSGSGHDEALAAGVERTVEGESAPDGYVANNKDCNDSSSSINPAAAEVRDEFDSIDENCNGNPLKDWYRDLDGDGRGDPNVSDAFEQAPPNYVLDNTDCDDTHYDLFDNCD